jgi:hypothetical protein
VKGGCIAPAMYVKTRGLEADAAGVAPDRPRTTKPTDRSGRMSWDAVAPEAASAHSVKATRRDAWRASSPTHGDPCTYDFTVSGTVSGSQLQAKRRPYVSRYGHRVKGTEVTKTLLSW